MKAIESGSETSVGRDESKGLLKLRLCTIVRHNIDP